jgi:hypothetical protein
MISDVWARDCTPLIKKSRVDFSYLRVSGFFFLLYSIYLGIVHFFVLNFMMLYGIERW